MALGLRICLLLLRAFEVRNKDFLKIQERGKFEDIVKNMDVLLTTKDVRVKEVLYDIS